MTELTRSVVLDERVHALRMRQFLLIIEGPGGTRHRIFSQRRVTIGSSPDNDVPIDDPAVSREHAMIEVDEQGYRLRDRGSKNGTRIGDLRVHDLFLVHDTRFTVGSTTLTFETTDEEVELLYSGRTRFGGMVGASMAMREIFGRLDRAALSDACILFEGRPGTGKELAALATHHHSHRRGGPFVVLDSSAVAADALERELFGTEHDGEVVRGALEQAAAGTLFIDDVDQLSAEVQARLSRALDARTYRRVGGSAAVPLTARVLAATDHELLRDVDAASFRSDLYYQLRVVHVVLPLLRERAEDIPLLVDHFLDKARERFGNRSLNITYATMERLKAHPWPGNVRELNSFLERAATLAAGDGSIDAAPAYVEAPTPSEAPRSRDAIDQFMRLAGSTSAMPFKDAKARLVEVFERQYWTRLLEQTDGNVSEAGRIAGVHRKSVEYILKKLEIDRKQPRGG